MPVLDPWLRQLTVANQLTLLRLFAVPAVALALLEGANGTAFALFVAAAITDRLDGIAARRLGQSTKLGMILDPAADKLMMIVTYVILSLPDHPRAFPHFQLRWHVPAWVTLLIVLRDVLIVVVAAALYLSLGLGRFPPSRLGKWATGTVMVCATIFLLGNVWTAISDLWLRLGIWAVSGITIVSGIDYLLRTRRMLQEIDSKKGP